MKDYIKKHVEIVQKVPTNPEQIEKLLVAFKNLNKTMNKISGKMPFDSEPGGYLKTLNQHHRKDEP